MNRLALPPIAFDVISSRWIAVPAALAALALLLAFQYVVRQSVERGAAMRQASAAVHDAAWRCRAMHQRGVFNQNCPVVPVHTAANAALRGQRLLARAGT